MKNVIIEIDQRVFGGFSAFTVAGFRAVGLTNVAASVWEEVIAPAEPRRVVDPDDIVGIPEIAAWRDTYRAMGLKPAEYRSSVEQLLRRKARGTLRPTGIAAVDIYNEASARELAPLGGYDVAKLSGAVLRVRPCAPESDRFEPIGGEAKRFPLKPAVVVYAQEDEILCWALNHRDAATTALTAETHEAIFLSEATTTAGSAASRRALDRVVGELTARGVQCSKVVELDVAKTRVVL